MFGTVARIRIKPGKQEELKAIAAEITAADPPGFVTNYVLRSKDDPQELWLVALFESEKAYYDNADRPETSAQYEKWMTLTEGPPEWHDVHVEAVQQAKSKA
jgi:quinol monooxygenase YgiN